MPPLRFGFLAHFAAVAATAAFAFACDPGANQDACGGHCGPGTECTPEGLCVPASVEAGDDEPEDESKGNKKRRKRRRGKKGGDEEGLEAEGGGPPIDDDSGVPRHNPNADKTIDLNAGSERLSDRVIDRELDELDAAFQKCIKDAVLRVDDLGKGTVRFEWGIKASGKVSGVNVKAPHNLVEAGVVPCVRKAIHRHRFPAFDGPTMSASSSFSI